MQVVRFGQGCETIWKKWLWWLQFIKGTEQLMLTLKMTILDTSWIQLHKWRIIKINWLRYLCSMFQDSSQKNEIRKLLHRKNSGATRNRLLILNQLLIYYPTLSTARSCQWTEGSTQWDNRLKHAHLRALQLNAHSNITCTCTQNCARPMHAHTFFRRGGKGVLKKHFSFPN